MRHVTIQDIAKEAKVSKSTVSRVLNNTTAVHPDKRKAILEATERLGFKPNVVARSLANGRSMTVGVLTQNIGSPFYDAISQGVTIGLNKTGYSALFVDGQWNKEEEEEGIRALIGRRVDGLILIGGEVSFRQLEERCSRIPTVLVARPAMKGEFPSFSLDNLEAGYRATHYLISCGHRLIAMIGGIGDHRDAIDRLAGYKKALSEGGLPFRPELVVDGDFSGQSGEKGVEALLAEKLAFTGIFAANDMAAFGARLALYRQGLRVPEDVSIIGFDDQAEAAFMAPPLTTIRQPARKMGEEASRALLGLIEGESVESRTFEGELQIRESVCKLGKGI